MSIDAEPIEEEVSAEEIDETSEELSSAESGRGSQEELAEPTPQYVTRDDYERSTQQVLSHLQSQFDRFSSRFEPLLKKPEPEKRELRNPFGDPYEWNQKYSDPEIHKKLTDLYTQFEDRIKTHEGELAKLREEKEQAEIANEIAARVEREFDSAVSKFPETFKRQGAQDLFSAIVHGYCVKNGIQGIRQITNLARQFDAIIGKGTDDRYNNKVNAIKSRPKGIPVVKGSSTKPKKKAPGQAKTLDEAAEDLKRELNRAFDEGEL